MNTREATTREIHPPLRRIVLDTLRRAPASARHAVGWMLVAWAVLVAMQVFDVSSRSGPAVAAELVSVVVGTTGILLLGVTHMLQRAGELTPTDRPNQLGQVLLALPAMAHAAGALLGFAIAVVIVRGLAGGPLPIVMISALVYTLMLALAMQMVVRTTRLLYRHAADGAQAAARAEAAAGEAQLLALQAQMNPHFLFNTLNTVAALVQSDARAAERTIENLADVLRRTLQRTRATQSTVGEELDYLRAYLAIEQARLGDRLRVTWSVAPQTRSLPLPPLVLQPLVENALCHAVANRREGGTIEIAATIEDSVLALSVADDGPGFAPQHRDGTGLGNLRQRLERRYGSAAQVQMQSSEHGTRVTVRVPCTEVQNASPDRR